MSEGLRLLMAQIDDAPGELLGRVLDQMTEMGAKNVQLLSSLGKKGRPGYVLLIDIDAEDEAEFAALMAGELGIWGYRVLQSQHKHFEIRRYQTRLEVRRGGHVSDFPLRIKRILSEGRFMRAKAEHDDLAAICVLLSQESKVHLAVLKAAVETAVGADEPGDVISIQLDGPA
jgi:uncharacterized protein (DUF111 family)